MGDHANISSKPKPVKVRTNNTAVETSQGERVHFKLIN